MYWFVVSRMVFFLCLFFLLSGEPINRSLAHTSQFFCFLPSPLSLFVLSLFDVTQQMSIGDGWPELSTSFLCGSSWVSRSTLAVGRYGEAIPRSLSK
ncbi:hypothetical protein GGR55DRAFT_628862 [Xylaria sp. FL0064]|nr:hypothetical protein GGR55DRAFT_628862 [Xylaria sp. FL0064]